MTSLSLHLLCSYIYISAKKISVNRSGHIRSCIIYSFTGCLDSGDKDDDDDGVETSMNHRFLAHFKIVTL